MDVRFWCLCCVKNVEVFDNRGEVDWIDFCFFFCNIILYVWFMEGKGLSISKFFFVWIYLVFNFIGNWISCCVCKIFDILGLVVYV